MCSLPIEDLSGVSIFMTVSFRTGLYNFHDWGVIQWLNFHYFSSTYYFINTFILIKVSLIGILL